MSNHSGKILFAAALLTASFVWAIPPGQQVPPSPRASTTAQQGTTQTAQQQQRAQDNTPQGSITVSGTLENQLRALDPTNTVDYSEGSFVLNFEDVDIRYVLLLLAHITGKTILPERSMAKDTITIIDPRPLTKTEAKSLIFTTLRSRGFTVVENDYLIRIATVADAPGEPIKTVLPTQAELDSEDIIRTQIIYPKYVPAKQLADTIKLLMSRLGGSSIVDENANILMLFDNGANIKRLLEIIDLIDTEKAGSDIDIRIVPMQYADEYEMVNKLEQIFNSPVLSDESARQMTLQRNTTSGTTVNRANPPAQTTENTSMSLGKSSANVSKATFIPDDRLHAVIVLSSRQNFPMILALIHDLDTPSKNSDEMYRIYPLQHAKAEEISSTLVAMFGSDSVSRSTTSSGSSSQNRNTSGNRNQINSGRSTSSSRSTGTRTSSSGTSFLSGKVSFQIDEPSNSLIIMTSPQYLDAVLAVVKKLDQRTPQAYIEAIIVEVTRDKDFDFGVGWQKVLGKGEHVNLIQALDTTMAPALESGRKEIVPDNMKGFNYAFGKYDKSGNFDPYFTLQTDEKINDINILSTPSIIASNNKTAMISVGQQIPIARYSRSGSDSSTRDYSYEYIDVNVELEVTPRINRHREVSLEVHVTVKENGGVAYASDPTSPPIILDREAQTEVVVQDSHTLVIGGLIKDSTQTTLSEIPVLCDIPLVKYLFRSEVRSQSKTELMVFITPTVILDSSEEEVLTEEVKTKFPNAIRFIKDETRENLTDKMNSTDRRKTIMDDWKVFEGHFDDAEYYLTGKSPNQNETIKMFEESYSPKTSPTYEPLFDSSAARRQKAEEEFLEKEQELLSE
ncbi:type II secretion system secretin GspD [bacterium]|nr:type II secretion system secretin GspD [bacterium]